MHVEVTFKGFKVSILSDSKYDRWWVASFTIVSTAAACLHVLD